MKTIKTMYKQMDPGSFKNCYQQTIHLQVIYIQYIYVDIGFGFK